MPRSVRSVTRHDLREIPADPDDALNSSGGLLPGPHATLAGPTFAEWLDAAS